MQVLDLLAQRVGLCHGLVELGIVGGAVSGDARSRGGELRRAGAFPLQLVRHAVELLLETRDGLCGVVAAAGVVARLPVGPRQAVLQRIERVPSALVLLQEALIPSLEVADALLGDLNAVEATGLHRFLQLLYVIVGGLEIRSQVFLHVSLNRSSMNASVSLPD